MIVLYIGLSTGVRLFFYVLSLGNIDNLFLETLRIFGLGFLYDLTVASIAFALYSLYLVLMPKKWIGSWLDKIFTYVYLILALLIIYFSLMAEFPFWEEFGVRFNFIAVDYLIYTYEVVANINQSYPIPLILVCLLLIIVSTFYGLRRFKVFNETFTDKISFGYRVILATPVLVLAFALGYFMNNKMADTSNNLYANELSKNGGFSFFAAYRSNELDYKIFYPNLSDENAYKILRKNILQENETFIDSNFNEIQTLTQGDPIQKTPNIVLVVIESFSADFLSSFGNTEQLTPNFEQLAREGVFFKNLFATGTRTVRGMEALTLSVPPTPGNSIVRRPNNDGLHSIAEVLQEKNYQLFFVYGGDGYFDNMNNFFGGQGFDIVDRDRGNPLSDGIKTTRYRIPTHEVNFENAWGISDEDIYTQTLKYADQAYTNETPFFQFVMTTSNHRPYTFPENKIDLPQGTRKSAVKYTDYALGRFIESAKNKPWFENTVFVIVADHCASSAGKWELNLDKHQIPAVIYNLSSQKGVNLDRLASQIDVMPTLFGYLGWTYSSALYGQDLNKTNSGDERAFIGNYRTLGMLKSGVFTQIDDRKQIKQFLVEDSTLNLIESPIISQELVNETIAYYQTASERFSSGKMKIKKP